MGRSRRLTASVLAVLACCLLVAPISALAPYGAASDASPPALHPAASPPVGAGSEWVVITLTNAEPFPTNADFQELVHFDSAEYAVYLNANLSNLRFAYPNGTAVPSWIEDNDTTASTNTTIFLNLTWGIPADGSVLVDAIFDPLGAFDWSVSGPSALSECLFATTTSDAGGGAGNSGPLYALVTGLLGIGIVVMAVVALTKRSKYDEE